MSTPLESSPIDGQAAKSGWAKFLGICLGDHEDKGKWVEDMRGSLSLVASIITTMTFQLATNPPGGVYQANGGNKVSDGERCLENYGIQCPGEAVLGVLYVDDYKKFLISNTISFIASLSVCLLLVSGIPLKNRFVIWVLSIGMCITITSLALTYLYAASMVTPDIIWNQTASNMFEGVLITWIALLCIVGIFIILRVLYHVIKWIRARSNTENRTSS